MSADLSEIRERARQHQETLDERRWMTVAMVARRFGASESTVRVIPIHGVPYKEFGRDRKYRRRRYRTADVEAYERSTFDTRAQPNSAHRPQNRVGP